MNADVTNETAEEFFEYERLCQQETKPLHLPKKVKKFGHIVLWAIGISITAIVLYMLWGVS